MISYWAYVFNNVEREILPNKGVRYKSVVIGASLTAVILHHCYLVAYIYRNNNKNDVEPDVKHTVVWIQ